MMMHAVDPWAVPTRPRERTHVMFAIAARTHILEAILLFGAVKILVAFMATNASTMNAAGWSMTALQTGDRSSDRAVDHSAESG